MTASRECPQKIGVFVVSFLATNQNRAASLFEPSERQNNLAQDGLANEFGEGKK